MGWQERLKCQPHLSHEVVTGIRALIKLAGEDENRGGLVDTPQRILKAWEFWTSGYDQDPAKILKTFEDGGQGYDQMIVQREIPIWSLCEHHCSPFFGVCTIGYLPQGTIVGLSKLARLVEIFARRLQVQERLTTQIANALQDNLKPLGVGVVVDCRHTCIESRGVCKAGSVTRTTCLLGRMKDDDKCRQEFLSSVKM